jgi:hypothetical protein
MSRVIRSGDFAARSPVAAADRCRSALLLVVLAAVGCGPGDTAYEDAGPLPLDTLGADTATGAVVVDTITPMTPIVPADAESPVVPTTSMPVRVPRDTARVAVVHGRAELEVDAKTYMPADYLLVRLESGRATAAEAWTTRTGEFFFENVRPGTYELQFLKSQKEPRPVYRMRVTVRAGERMLLPVVHIPIDSIKSPTRG